MPCRVPGLRLGGGMHDAGSLGDIGYAESIEQLHIHWRGTPVASHYRYISTLKDGCRLRVREADAALAGSRSRPLARCFRRHLVGRLRRFR